MQRLLDTGAVHIVGRAGELGNVPIINVDVGKVAKEILNKAGKNDKDLIKQYFTFWFTWVYDNMMVPGRIERMILIFDLKGVKVRDIPLKPLYELLKL